MDASIILFWPGAAEPLKVRKICRKEPERKRMIIFCEKQHIVSFLSFQLISHQINHRSENNSLPIYLNEGNAFMQRVEGRRGIRGTAVSLQQES